jgi:type VI protein secretion system component VasK
MMSKGNGNGTGELRTSDLYMAAYLQTAGVPMKKTERASENGKVYFVFDTSICNIEELRAAWFNNSGKVPANPYAYAIKNLKSLCHLK